MMFELLRVFGLLRILRGGEILPDAGKVYPQSIYAYAQRVYSGG